MQLTADPPARDECLALMDARGMLKNIRAHSLRVCEVALAVVDPLRWHGAPVDRPLVEAGALLHDITKTESLHTQENHAATGEELLVSLGCPRTGAVVGRHILPGEHDGLDEADIVAYADKRVVHDEIVTLDGRFAYLFETYGDSPRAQRFYDSMRRRMDSIERRFARTVGRPLDDFLDSIN